MVWISFRAVPHGLFGVRYGSPRAILGPELLGLFLGNAVTVISVCEDLFFKGLSNESGAPVGISIRKTGFKAA
ncbi:MAG TPA: hypothetical protein VGG46_02010 [Terriglobales bacterium]